MRALPPIVQEFSRYFSRAGYQIYLVGGAVRSLVMGTEPKDWDFASDARPEQVIPLFKKVIPTGQAHGTVTVLFRGMQFEVTTFRIDGNYSDHRRPDSVSYSSSILEDLKRRDFTMNAMAIELPGKKFLDPHQGRADIRKKIIRTVGNPMLRFREDALRIMRALRFTSLLGFQIEAETFGAMKLEAANLAGVSVERFRDEFLHLCSGSYCLPALEMGIESAAFDPWLPELREAHDFDGTGEEHSLVRHFFRTLAQIQTYLPENGGSLEKQSLLLAALFHDIAKPRTFTKEPEGKVSFRGHDELGASICENILRRLKLPKKVIEGSCHLIRHHMFDHRIANNPPAVRRLIARVGRENIHDLLRLRRADILAKVEGRIAGSYLPSLEDLDRLLQAVQEELEGASFTLKDLRLDGNILMEKLEIPPGPILGAILQELLQTVIDDPLMNEEERLLKLARNLWMERKGRS